MNRICETCKHKSNQTEIETLYPCNECLHMIRLNHYESEFPLNKLKKGWD